MLRTDRQARVQHVFTLLMALLLASILTACAQTPGTTPGSTQGTTATVTTTVQTSQQSFTLAELAQYDGQNGQPAYIAIDGIVYDVTKVAVWDGNKHAGRFIAGKDYTDELKKAPHTADKLKEAPPIGTLVP